MKFVATSLLILGITACLPTQTTFARAESAGDAPHPTVEKHGKWIADAAGDIQTSLVWHQVRPCEVVVDCKYPVGNELLSLLYAVYTAKLLGTVLKAHNDNHGCYGGLFGDAVDALHFNFTPPTETDMPRQGGCEGTFPIDFWHDQPGFNPTSEEWHETAELIKPRLQPIPCNSTSQQTCSRYKTAVYLRAGDIFLQSPHYLYTQAPCAYYSMVLEQVLPPGSDGSDISIVTDFGAHENLQNPCTQVLLQRYPNATKERRNAAQDWWELATAANLVLPGSSTFGLTAALLSSKTRNVFMPSWTEVDLRDSVADGTLHLDAARLQHPESSTSNPWFFFLNSMPTFTTHRYLLQNYTTVWSELVFPKVSLHPREMVTKLPRSMVHSITPAVALQSITLILGCIGDSPAALAEVVNKLWYSHVPCTQPPKEKYIPLIVFVPGGWPEEVMKLINIPRKYHVVILEDTQVFTNETSPPSDWNDTSRFSRTEKGYCLRPQVRSLLNAMATNPFRSTHLLWSYEQNTTKTIEMYQHIMNRHQHTSTIVTYKPSGSSQYEGSTDFAASGGYLVAPAYSQSLTTSLSAFTYLPNRHVSLQTFCLSTLFHAHCSKKYAR